MSQQQVAQIEERVRQLLLKLRAAKQVGVQKLTNNGVDIASMNQSVKRLYELIGEIVVGGVRPDNINEFIRSAEEVTFSTADIEEFDCGEVIQAGDSFVISDITEEERVSLTETLNLFLHSIEEFDEGDGASVSDTCDVILEQK